MSNITVAVTNSFNDTVTMLPPSAYIEGFGQVNFHNNPRLEFDGATISRNFDHHIDFRITKNKLHQELLDERYNHYPRLKRRTQYLSVYQFNKDRRLDDQITIPHYYMATLREGEHVGITNFGIPNCKKVVIKEQLGARGSNQVVVPTNMLTTLLKHSKGKTLGEVRDMFPDLIYTDNSNWEMMFFDDPNDLFISELITNVKSEYRLLVGGDKVYGRERTIKAGPYPQANLEIDKFHSVQEVKYEPIEDMFDETLVKTLYDFVAFIDLPIGSVDLYSTTDGTWGIFEYSTQFAFHGANPNFIRQLLLDGVKQVLQSPKRASTENKRTIQLAQSESDSLNDLGSVIKAVQLNVTPVKLPEIITTGESLPDTHEFFRHLSNSYALFIDTLHLGFIDPRHETSKITKLIQHNEDDNMWYYRIEAGSLSLDINNRSPLTTLLSFQTQELNGFLARCQSEIKTGVYFDLVGLVNRITVQANELAKLHYAAEIDQRVIQTTERFIDHIMLSVISKYNEMLTLIYRSEKRSLIPAVQYEWSSDDKAYHIKCESLPLKISGGELYVNDDVRLETWVTNTLSRSNDETLIKLSNKILQELNELVIDYNNLYTDDDSVKDKLYVKLTEQILADRRLRMTR